MNTYEIWFDPYGDVTFVNADRYEFIDNYYVFFINNISVDKFKADEVLRIEEL